MLKFQLGFVSCGVVFACVLACVFVCSCACMSFLDGILMLPFDGYYR